MQVIVMFILFQRQQFNEASFKVYEHEQSRAKASEYMVRNGTIPLKECTATQLQRNIA